MLKSHVNLFIVFTILSLSIKGQSIDKNYPTKKNKSNDTSIILSDIVAAPDLNTINEEEFKTVQVAPKFPGGIKAWQKYLEANLNTNIPITNDAPSGIYTVLVSFIINNNGNISEVQALNNPGYGTAEEAVRVIKASPSWIPAIQNGRKVIYRQKQRISFKVGKYDKIDTSQTSFNELLINMDAAAKNFESVDSILFNEYLDRGIENINNENYQEALENLDWAIFYDSLQFKGYYFRGVAKSELNDHIGSINDFTKSIHINKYIYQCYFLRGNEEAKIGSYHNAIRDFSKTIQLDSTVAEAYFNRGMLIMASDKSSACIDLQKAKSLGCDKAEEFIKKYCE